jgi:hypothetical protein
MDLRPDAEPHLTDPGSANRQGSGGWKDRPNDVQVGALFRAIRRKLGLRQSDAADMPDSTVSLRCGRIRG